VTIQPEAREQGPIEVLRFEQEWAAGRILGAYQGWPLADSQQRFDDALAQVEALVEAARHMVAVYPDPTSIATNRLYFALAPFMKDTP
jgi:hypothetical protein